MKRLTEIMLNVLLIMGGILVAFGVSMIYTPAGIIAAGILTIAAVVLTIKGGDSP